MTQRPMGEPSSNLFPVYDATQERIARLEAQVGRIMWDPRMSQLLQGPLPVSENFMGLRRIGSAGSYYLAGTVGTVSDNSRTMTVIANAVYAAPFHVAEPVQVDRLGLYPSAFSGSWRMAVYETSHKPAGDTLHYYPARKVPGTQTGTQTMAAGFNGVTFSPRFTLYRGLHWIVCCFSATPTMFRIPYEQGTGWEILGRTTGISTAMLIGWRASHTYGAMPEVFPTAGGITTRNLPLMWVRLRG